MLLVAEVLGHGDAGESDAEARARRLVHLAEDHHRLGDDARFGHLEVEVVPLARALADAGEHRVAAVLGGDVADQLLDDDGLADAGAAEEPDLPALGVGSEQIHDLDPGLEDLGLGLLVLERRRLAVDGVHLPAGERGLPVDRVAGQVEDAPERAHADRHHDRRPRVDGRHAAHEAVGRGEGDATDHVVSDVERHLAGQVDAALLVLDLDRVHEQRQAVGAEAHVHGRPDDLHHPADVLDVLFAVCHSGRFSSGRRSWFERPT